MRAPFRLLARGDLRFLDQALALDLALAHLALGFDPGFRDDLFVGDALLLDLFAGEDLGLFRFGLALGTLAHQFRALLGAPELDVAFLAQPRLLALALDVEGFLLGLEVPGPDPDCGVLLDVISLLAIGFDVLDEPGKALGVENRLDGLKYSRPVWSTIADGDGFELEPVEVEPLLRQLLHPAHVLGALLVHLLHRHLGGDRPECGDELARKQVVQPFLLHAAMASVRRRATPPRGLPSPVRRIPLPRPPACGRA